MAVCFWYQLNFQNKNALTIEINRTQYCDFVYFIPSKLTNFETVLDRKILNSKFTLKKSLNRYLIEFLKYSP
ncbi:unnamed protein product, partial [Ceratitis capitata]